MPGKAGRNRFLPREQSCTYPLSIWFFSRYPVSLDDIAEHNSFASQATSNFLTFDGRGFGSKGREQRRTTLCTSRLWKLIGKKNFEEFTVLLKVVWSTRQKGLRLIHTCETPSWSARFRHQMRVKLCWIFKETLPQNASRKRIHLHCEWALRVINWQPKPATSRLRVNVDDLVRSFDLWSKSGQQLGGGIISGFGERCQFIASSTSRACSVET